MTRRDPESSRTLIELGLMSHGLAPTKTAVKHRTYEEEDSPFLITPSPTIWRDVVSVFAIFGAALVLSYLVSDPQKPNAMFVPVAAIAVATAA